MRGQLETARQRLDRGWVQGFNARNFYMSSVPAASADACCWCIVGSLMAGGADADEVDEAVAQLGFQSVFDAMRWNDAPGRTQAEVLARFDHAIHEGVMQNAA